MRYLVRATGMNGPVERVIDAADTAEAEQLFRKQSRSRCFRAYAEQCAIGDPWREFTFKEL